MSKSRSLVFDNFKAILEDAEPLESDLYDKRNGIYVRNASFSPEAYLSYVRILAFLALDAKVGRRTAYLTRLGYIPLIMPPSFWEREVFALTCKFPENLPFISLKPVSFRGFYYKSDIYDLWVSKLDVAKLWGWNPEDVTVRAVFKKCGI